MASWVASQFVESGGVVRDLVTGQVGAVEGAVVLHVLGVVLPFCDPLVTDLATASIGAVMAVAAARAIA